ncbi:hypothetical protein [Nocardia lasii]|uniref:Uncharacterized protein n=1 Tax=Nocardia lasii TaxID=1616107 RepID=A0ABW1JRT5_9NOCA
MPESCVLKKRHYEATQFTRRLMADDTPARIRGYLTAVADVLTALDAKAKKSMTTGREP